MNSSVFLRFLQEEYMNLLGKQDNKTTLFWKRKPAESIQLCSIPPLEYRKFAGSEAEICSFKNFLVEMLKNETVHLSDGSEIPASEYFYHKALETSRVPPFNPLYPHLISIMKLFSENEVEEHFGPGYLQAYRRMLLVYATPQRY